jgi:diadenosine tetraphosphate (Ap4A) HIT family hydrolase
MVEVESMSSECLSCLGLAGAPRISPGLPIHIGNYWQVEHAHLSKLVGSLVIALRRHAVALHELTADQFMELGEARGFEHIHFHVVPRAHDMPEELMSAGSFELIRVSRADAADPVQVKAFLESLQETIAHQITQQAHAASRGR